jgi:glutamine synthetase
MANVAHTDELQYFMKANPDVRFLELLQPDMNGIFRGKRVPVHDAGKLFKEGLNYCASSVFMDAKGELYTHVPYGGRDGDPDVLGHAVPNSLRPVPWSTQPQGQLLLRLSNADGSDFFGDPRSILSHALKPLEEMGLTPVVATELEFYLIEHDGASFQPKVDRIPGSDLVQDGVQYGSLDDLALVDEFLADLDDVFRVQDIPAGAVMSEYAPGQFEVNLKHVNDAVLACDHALLLKRAVKAVAQKHGLAASFMAKAFSDLAGCGLHVHISLLDQDGNNVFAGQSADGPFSDTLRHAIGGMAELMPESMAIFAPNANSYRRYSGGSFVPREANWGQNHRHLALRLPLASAENTRVEHRVAGADANPYLVTAAVVAGIHHGIVHRCDPGPMVREGQEIERQVTLPVRWEAAFDAFAGGDALPRYLGRQYHDAYNKCRREEYDRFQAEVGNLDYEWYLRAL